MSRLTERYTNKGISGVCLKALDYKGNTADSSLVLERLAEFEDIMEKYNLNVVCDIEHIFIQFKSAMNDIRELIDENKKLKEKWQKLKNTISSKQYIKDKTNSNFVATIGSMGVEIFCEMLLKEMENLETGEKK